MLTVLDLFSGIGGFSLGLERTGGFKTVAFCEIDPFCRKVLKKHWPEVPIYEDVTQLSLSAGFADVVCGGFPCQDISLAGKGAGLEGKRSGLWSEYARIIGEVRPKYVIVENVAALLGRGLGRVLGDLAALGFDAEWHCIPASAVGAAQNRDRLWIIADSWKGKKRAYWISRLPKIKRDDWTRLVRPGRSRGDYEIPDWMDRVGSLGNAVVPQIPELIGRAILEAEKSSPSTSQYPTPGIGPHERR